jgi:hypothetical protein
MSHEKSVLAGNLKNLCECQACLKIRITALKKANQELEQKNRILWNAVVNANLSLADVLSETNYFGKRKLRII